MSHGLRQQTTFRVPLRVLLWGHRLTETVQFQIGKTSWDRILDNEQCAVCFCSEPVNGNRCVCASLEVQEVRRRSWIRWSMSCRFVNLRRIVGNGVLVYRQLLWQQIFFSARSFHPMNLTEIYYSKDTFEYIYIYILIDLNHFKFSLSFGREFLTLITTWFFC